ncbi:alpha/beta hydrolase family protein [Roseibium sp.]|uniref:alpha/beta hydrolase family protein n=1 Tax=Roseibium sp. TaxID=1936156 RepID=UPI003A96EBC3
MSGWSHRSAAILAACGFLAYPHSYSVGGNAWNAGSIRNVELTRTLNAMTALRQFPTCSGNIALYGVSRGAEHALLVSCLAANEGSPELPQAVACLAAPDVVCGAFDARSYRDHGDPGWQAWDPADRAWLWRGKSDALLPTTPIPVEAFEGPMFLSAGLKDQTWSPQMTKRLEERRRNAGQPVEAHYYSDESHIPGSDGENHHHHLLMTFLEKHLTAI